LAITDLPAADVQLDRTLDRTGRRSYGTTSSTSQTVGVYPGFDRFGRVKRQAWVLGPAVSTGSPAHPDSRELVNFTYFYDKVGNLPWARISTPFIDNPYGYCGYLFDVETAAAQINGPNGGGLYQCRFRVYDPVAGRWLQVDPAGFVDGMNLYQ
jgi:RHS repeat-associated protein